MHLSIINCSPKGKTGNTEIVSRYFIEGFESNGVNTSTVHYKRDMTERMLLEIASRSDIIIAAFPLYVYSLPSGTIEVMRRIADVLKDKKIKMGFLCQYGFLEACHARPLEHLLHRFCGETGLTDIGVLIRGGCEGLKSKPEKKQKAMHDKFFSMGQELAEKGFFSQASLDSFSSPEMVSNGLFSKIRAAVFIFIGNHFYWKKLLRKNGAKNQHWNQPFTEKR